MSAPRITLISKLIRKKLYEEVDRILSISRQGFDIHVKSDFVEVEEILLEILEKELTINTREFRLVREAHAIDLQTQNDDTAFLPTLFISSQPLLNGYGFAYFALSTPDQLLGSVASSIETILDHFGLCVYLDIFDSHILMQFKQITRIYGLNTLIDAVVQTAYLGGFQGDTRKAKKYLEHLQAENPLNAGKNKYTLEKCAEMFLSHVILRGENAHSFLKSSLSYFMSRTTLQEHLKLADQLGVSQFFDGART